MYSSTTTMMMRLSSSCRRIRPSSFSSSCIATGSVSTKTSNIPTTVVRTTSSILRSNTNSSFQNHAFHVRCFSSSASSKESILQTYNAKDDHNHCVNLVQQRDREGYLCGLLMPSKAREAYFAIRAFNVEIASIKDGRRLGTGAGGGNSSTNTSEGSSLALQMRIQWWREAIDEIYTKEDDVQTKSSESKKSSSNPLSLPACWHNPVVRSLYYANQQQQQQQPNDGGQSSFVLTRRFLERLIDAREIDLNIEQFATLDDATMYAEDTVSSLLYLSLESVGIQNDHADEVASHAGMGIGLTMALRSTIHRLLVGELSIPADALPQSIPTKYLMDRVVLQEDDDNEFQSNPEYDDTLRQGVQNVAHVASLHLSKARELQTQIPKEGRSCLLPIVPNLHYLDTLQQCQYDLWDTQVAMEQSKFRSLALLGRAWMTGVC